MANLFDLHPDFSLDSYAIVQELNQSTAYQCYEDLKHYSKEFKVNIFEEDYPQHVLHQEVL